MSEVQVTLEQVVELVQNDEGVREALRSQFVTPEAVGAFLETEEGNKLVQPIKDSAVSKGISTWKNNHLQKLIDEAIINANPADTPEQKRIRELELRMQEADNKAILAQQEAYALSLATQRGLPAGLVKKFVGKTAEETLQGMNAYEMEFKSALQVEVEKQLGGTARRHLPDNPNVTEHQGKPQRKLSDLSITERNALYMSDRNLYEQMKQQG